MNTLIIFDLDHTIIHSNYNNNILYIYVRPNFTELINYLKENNYDIAFWSLGEVKYVNLIYDFLKKNYLVDINPLFVLSKIPELNSYTDILSDIKINSHTNGYELVKNVNTLLSYYSIDINKTILVDDLISNININNKNNVYYIKKWFSTMIWDTELNNFKNLLVNLRIYTNY
jgi:hypothetical protein|tara:strand:+ start:4011 stop:4529 length:519 start_codon:yes stop_codon:yes gene_type:complete